MCTDGAPLDAGWYTGGMQEVATARRLVDRALERLEAEADDHPLKAIDPMKLRRLLAEAAFREIRSLQREIAEESRDPS